MTLSDLKLICQGHDITQCEITQKLYKIELYLQWRTNRCELSNGAVFNDLEKLLT